MTYEEARASLTCASWDAGAGRVTLRGEATSRARTERDGISGVASAEGKIELVVDVGDHRFQSVSFDGDAGLEATGPGGVEVRGEGQLKADLGTRRVEDAERLRRAAPRFRKAVHDVRDLGVTLEVPSSWGRVETEDGSFRLTRTTGADRGEAWLGVLSFDPGETDDEKALAAMRADFEATYERVRTRKVSSPLGKGLSFECETEVDGDTVSFVIDCYPREGRGVMLTLHGQGDVLREARREFEAARKSLRVAAR